MAQSTKQESTSDRFNRFHLAVAVHQEQCAWVLGPLEAEIDLPGLGLLRELNEKLLALIELQDCR